MLEMVHYMLRFIITMKHVIYNNNNNNNNTDNF